MADAQDVQSPLEATIDALAATLVAAADGRLRVAFNEAADSRDSDPGALRFLKLDETRLGRDFKVYAFMDNMMGEGAVMSDLLRELVLPLESTVPQAYDAGLDFMEEQAATQGERAEDWKGLIASLRP